MQYLNILFILLTLVVTKELKSIEFNEEQPSNIDSIFVTREVSIPEKLIYFKLLQLINIFFIETNPEVSKFDKSTSNSAFIFSKMLSNDNIFLSHSIFILYIGI